MKHICCYKNLYLIWLIITAIGVLKLFQQAKATLLSTLSLPCAQKENIEELFACSAGVYHHMKLAMMQQGTYETFFVIWLSLALLPPALLFFLQLVKSIRPKGEKNETHF